MRSTFWPNRTFERQSSQNRHTGLKFSSKRENSALFMKIVQNALFRSCAARFGQIAFLSVKVLKIVTLAWNSRKTGKQCAFHENCTKRSFQVMGSTFWPNRTFERQSSQNRHTGLKFSPKRENSALFMKIVQNALFRSCEARFGQIALLSGKVLKIVTLAWNSLQNGKTVRFSWKLYKTLFSGHAQHVLAKSHFWASKFSKSSHWPEILFKTGKQCAFHENCTKRSFQVMRSTFWPNRIFERQSSQNRHTGLVSNSRQNGKTVRFSWKLYKTLFSGHGKHVLAKSNLWASKFSKSSHWPEILAKTGKQCAFHENCTKRSFQVMGSTFWPNRIFERQSSQNRHTGLKFSSKRENSALFMKIVQNALCRSCAARFGQIAFLSVKVLKIVTLAWNSRQNGKTVRFSWKLYKTLFSGHAQHVLAKSHFWASKFSKSSHWPEILFKTGKQCAFHENCTKRSFQVMRSTFWPNRIFKPQSSQNRHTGLKFSPKRENSALFMKIVQNALFRSCEARFGQIAFWASKFSKSSHWPEILAKTGKQCAFPWKLYKTLFSGHAEHVLAKSHFWAAKFSKSSHWPEILAKTGKQCAFHENCTKRSFQVMRSTFWPNRTFNPKLWKSSHWPEILAKTGKQCAFHENCTKRSFQVMRSTFWPNRIFERQSSQNRHTGLKFSPKRENSALFMKIVQNALFRSCAARFGQIAFLSVKVLKIVTLAWNSLQNGKTVRFSWKLYKTLFSGHAQHVLAKSHFWASKFSKSSHWPEILAKTENSALFMKIVQNALFRSCGSTFWPNRIFKPQSSQNRHTGLKFSPKRRKQRAFHENWTKRSFQVMRSTFWPNRIFERQSSQNRQTGLKFSSKRENSALFMKIVQNALFRSCAARFGQIAFLSGKVLKIVTLAWNSLQNGKTVRFSWKLYKTLFSGHAEARFGQIAFLSVKVLKIVTLAWNSRQNGKTVRFSWKLYKTLFSGHGKHVLAKSHFWASKFSKSSHWPEILAKRENSALFMKIVQNALFRSCAARFGQIAFLSVKVLKIVTLAWNSRQNGKTVRFSWKLYKTLFSGHAQHVLAKSHFWASLVLKIVTLAWNSLQNGKTVRFS